MRERTALEQLIIDAVASGVSVNMALVAFVSRGAYPGHRKDVVRLVDRALQKLRRQGALVYDRKRGWTLPMGTSRKPAKGS